jgi:hypothetical protein
VNAALLEFLVSSLEYFEGLMVPGGDGFANVDLEFEVSSSVVTGERNSKGGSHIYLRLIGVWT